MACWLTENASTSIVHPQNNSVGADYISYMQICSSFAVFEQCNAYKPLKICSYKTKKHYFLIWNIDTQFSVEFQKTARNLEKYLELGNL